MDQNDISIIPITKRKISETNTSKTPDFHILFNSINCYIEVKSGLMPITSISQAPNRKTVN